MNCSLLASRRRIQDKKSYRGACIRGLRFIAFGLLVGIGEGLISVRLLYLFLLRSYSSVLTFNLQNARWSCSHIPLALFEYLNHQQFKYVQIKYIRKIDLINFMRLKATCIKTYYLTKMPTNTPR